MEHDPRTSDRTRSVLTFRAITIKLATEDDHSLKKIPGLTLELKANDRVVDAVNLLFHESITDTWKSDQILILSTTDTGFILSAFMKVSGEKRQLVCSVELDGQELYSRSGTQFESRLMGHESYPSMILNTEVVVTPRENQAEAAKDIIKHLERKAVTQIRDFERHQDLDSLQQAISQLQFAVEVASENNLHQVEIPSVLGVALIRRFEHLGRLEDIDEAVVQQQVAVSLTPDEHPGKSGLLSDFGSSLKTRFERLGRLEDIDDAIAQQRAAVNLNLDGHPENPAWLNNLGNFLQIRFERLGRLEDIDDAIVQHQAAVTLTPDKHPSKPMRLKTLGSSLLTRFERLGRLEDIEDAVIQQQTAVSLAPDDHPDKPALLGDLGASLLTRFERLGHLEDINDAVARYQAAVNLAPDDHPSKPMLLNNLRNALQTRFERLGHPEDIEDAVAQKQAAINLTSDGHPDKPVFLSDLRVSLQSRFKLLGRLEDIDDAVAQQQVAADLTPDGHPEKSKRLNDLGRSLEIRFNHSKYPHDAEASIIQYRAAAKSFVGSPSIRLEAAKAWACLASTTNHKTLLDAYECALDIIPLVAWLGLPIAERHERLIQIGEIARNAASAAIELQHYGQALEWLEQGRSIVWTQVLQLRTPVDHLREVQPELADRLLHVSKLLDRGDQQDNSLDSTKLSLEEEGRRYRASAIEWETLISRARVIPGFEDFLTPPRISRLVGAARDGPVIAVNVAEKRCDALILLHGVDEVIHVPLPNFTLKKAIQLQAHMKALMTSSDVRPQMPQSPASGMSSDEGCKQVLAELWNHLVNPVLDCLGFSPCPDTDTPPRIWWCVTGPLAFLPIHAAGIYDGELDNSHIFDRVISSYTPTLTLLLESPNATKSTFFRLLSVIEPSSDRSYIPNMEQELNKIQSPPENRELVVRQGPEATKVNVVQGMKDCNWLHLARRETQNIKEPMKSALLLHDDNLTLEDIIMLDLPNAEFAFLSACQTTTGDEYLTDQSVHIAGGMLLAGYRSVVATMWHIEDTLAPEVAEEFYRHLMKDGVRPDSRRAAEALHFSMKRLRQGKKIPMISWIPFVHLGV